MAGNQSSGCDGCGEQPSVVMRPSDDEPQTRLRLVRNEDGDLWVSVMTPVEFGHALSDAVRFCTHQGGGHSPRTRAALQALFEAMQRDNEEHEEARHEGQ